MGRVGGMTLQKIKDNIKLNELQAPDGAVAMNSQKITGMAAAVAQHDAIAADANVRAPNATQLQGETPAAFEDTGVAAGLISSHTTPGAHHTKFTITEHDVVARHPLANLNSAVCSETEAAGLITTHTEDVDAHHAKTAESAPGCNPTTFRRNPATGTCSSPANLNDGDTDGSVASFNAINKYAEVDFGKNVSIYLWRQFGVTDSDGDGRFKIEYYNGAWHDWVTGLAVRITDDWSAFAAGTIVVCSKIRVTCTTVDNCGNTHIRELEIIY